MSGSPPAVQKGIDFLTELIETKGAELEGRLPSIQKLSELGGISLVTMWKAVRELSASGRLSVVHGQGIRIVGSMLVANDSIQARIARVVAPKHERKWEVVKAATIRDIVNGKYPPGEPMPSLKELSHRYGSCFQTLQKALNSLAAEGILEPNNRSYRVPALAGRKPGSTLVVIGRGDLRGELTDWTPWGQEFVRILERICAKSGVKLVSYVYASYNDQLVYIDSNGKRHSSLVIDDSVLGFMLRSISEDKLHIDVIQQLVAFKRYIAISDEGSCYPLPMPFSNNRKIQIFSVATGSLASRQVARFLLELGHTRIAFISPYHETCWSQNRQSGFEDVYRDAGHEGAVQSFTIDDYPFPGGVALKKSPSRTALTQMLQSSIDDWPQDEQGIESLRDGLKSYLRHVGETEHLRAVMQPLFRRTFQAKKTTVWVCVNDRIAVMAREFLERQDAINGESPIAVVSFDDTYDAFRCGFSSFNFNIPALIRAMFSFVLYPNQTNRQHAGNEVVQINGMIMQRGIRRIRKENKG